MLRVLRAHAALTHVAHATESYSSRATESDVSHCKPTLAHVARAAESDFSRATESDISLSDSGEDMPDISYDEDLLSMKQYESHASLAHTLVHDARPAKSDVSLSDHDEDELMPVLSYEEDLLMRQFDIANPNHAEPVELAAHTLRNTLYGRH